MLLQQRRSSFLGFSSLSPRRRSRQEEGKQAATHNSYQQKPAFLVVFTQHDIPSESLSEELVLFSHIRIVCR